MEEKKPGRGGARRQGRNQTMKSYRIDNDNVDFLATVDNANGYVNDAIREKRLREKNN